MSVPTLPEETWKKMNWFQKGLRGLSAIPGVGLVVGAGYALAGEGELAKDAVEITVVGTMKVLEDFSSDPDAHMPSND
ncbi:hypothetical protein DAPPUDRAFT_301646 [Daphnia pulex]|uniref:Uncharacterized protein n=1 Tax=Daphnia pulex TaxID=6669 RepID=E9GA10_DAPPU|nr:hypothetical protein DAPPUDRAFT_301646 [Daphnia pulex]|eukprot:EFX83662.1 hypothetical protein DAPPUDRAFT_301646 [Daphnia pulex]